MPSDRSRQALSDIRDNIKLAQSFVVGLNEVTFKADQKAFYAVVRAIIYLTKRTDPVTHDSTGRHH